MTLESEVALIESEMLEVKSIFLAIVKLLKAFNITDPQLLPYGLKPHTRSVSWIVEQVITQQTKFHAAQLRLADVDINVPDTCLHDCILLKLDYKYYVNIKIHNVDGRHNKNDISAVEKLYTQYTVNADYRLIYACFPVKFQNVEISFVHEGVHVFSPQFLPIYVNPRNDKIQAFYHHTPILRTRTEFLRLLKDNSKSIVLQ
ncbi:MAG: hypothetical protein MSG64_01025 [Pyrinomonadaceae bacterium MAG19_C2-C3]|nr:hypothetical protein [Pyrinomonadaceae bacterium MAG19_C2-C3]